jgi:hypothetical protein
MATTSHLARRWNGNGHIDSICSRCYRIIANAKTEEEFVQSEPLRACDAEALLCKT